MNTLLRLQLKKVYGEDFDISIQDKKFQKFISLIEEAYHDFEAEEKLLEHVLRISEEELHEANTLLRQKQELLKNVENSVDDAIFYKDLNHRYIGCNKKFADFLQCKEEDIIGKTDYAFFDYQTALKYYKTNEILLKNKNKIVYKQWINYKGTKVYLLVTKTPLFDDKGNVIGIVGISRDITHEYELQKDIEHKNIMLIQQNKLVSMGEMIANIAHQWRQPLNTLSIIIQKMNIFYKRKITTDEMIDENVSEAMLLIQGMSETIDDFRNFFNPKRVLEDFDLQEAIVKSYSIIRPLLTTNNIDFKMNIKDQYFIYGYKNEFFQVILNLLNNAIDALISDKVLSPTITINVTKSKKEKEIVIKISDNANSIEDPILEKIFHPYFTTKENGTGLGLYMSKIIIENHMKGEINVRNTPQGKTFAIYLKGGLRH